MGSNVMIQRAAVCAVVMVFFSFCTLAQWCDVSLTEQIAAPDQSQRSFFGSDLQVYGDMAFVGASIQNVNGIEAGAVHINRFDGFQWTYDSTLMPPSGENSEYFGGSISVGPDWLLIGAREVGEDYATASVYCYRYIEGQWELEQKLVPSDKHASAFSAIVVHDGNLAFVGAVGVLNTSDGPEPGAGYVFEYDGERWIETQKLMPADGTPGDLYGISPKLHGNRLVVGAPRHDEEDYFLQNGAVYIYEFDGNQWEETQKLIPPFFETGHWFGKDLWLQEDKIFVADPTRFALARSSEVVVYERTDGVWLNANVIESPEPNSTDQFGCEIEIQGGVMLIGASRAEEGVGKAYIYRHIDGVWKETGEINSEIDDPDQSFGSRIELFGDSVLIGAPRAFDSRGHVSVFDLACRVCQVDMDDDGVLEFEDVSVFLALFGAEASAADFNGDGQVNYFDISEFLFQFSGGC
jgi:FG-GAP repeat